MDDIEKGLVDWGRRWRETQGPYEPLATRPRSRPNGWLQALQFGGFLVAAGGLVVAIVLLRAGPTPPINAFAGSANTSLVEVGDSVVAAGDLVANTNGSYALCSPESARPAIAPLLLPQCSQYSVAVMRIDPRHVPGWTSVSKGGGYAANVTVKGVWTGGGIAATAVVKTPSSALSPAPCGLDINGPVAPSGVQGESALRPLAAEIAAKPALYSGLWSGSLAGRSIPVVGLVVGQESQGAILRALYPYQLCIEPVQRSAAVLNGLTATLSVAHPEWSPSLDLPHNRVAIVVTVLDASTAKTLSSYSSTVYVSSLVETAP